MLLIELGYGGDNGGYGLQMMTVGLIKGVQLLAVDVKHGKYRCIAPSQGDHNLGARLAAACDVTGELLYIGHHDGFITLQRGSTHATPASNAIASYRTLKWAQVQHTVGTHDIETGPPEMHRFMYQSGYIGHHRNRVVLALNQGTHLRHKLTIFLFFCHHFSLLAQR